MNNKILLLILPLLLIFAACKVSYSLRDVSIPANVKTAKIAYIENKARYVNPQLSPKVTDKLIQKIVGQTKLTATNSDDAHYQISGYISDYSVTTAAISPQAATSNRLTVAAHIVFLNTLENKTEEFDVSTNLDFDATLSLQEAEGRLLEEIVKNITDQIFNHIFSNW